MMESRFSWLLLESISHDIQEEHYVAIHVSNDTRELTVFIEFMLTAIKASLIDANNASDEASDRVLDKTTMRWKKNKKFLNIHPDIMTTALRAVCGISVATAYRILASLVEEDMYTKYRESGHWAYKLK